jgi:hypothetical protein
MDCKDKKLRETLTRILQLNVPINTLCPPGGLKHELIATTELFFNRSVKILHLAAFRSVKTSIPQRLRDEGF